MATWSLPLELCEQRGDAGARVVDASMDDASMDDTSMDDISAVDADEAKHRAEREWGECVRCLVGRAH